MTKRIYPLFVNQSLTIPNDPSISIVIAIGTKPLCDYQWILHIRQQCVQYGFSFLFYSTGPVFRKDGEIYHIPKKEQREQAKKANIDLSVDDHLFQRLNRSKFRSRFHLLEKERSMIEQKGMETIHQHAYQLIRSRLAPAVIENDGKQTPMKGHPVFIAQHATATCCRSCLYKWYHIEKDKELSAEEIDSIVSVIDQWILNQYRSR